MRTNRYTHVIDGQPLVGVDGDAEETRISLKPKCYNVQTDIQGESLLGSYETSCVGDTGKPNQC